MLIPIDEVVHVPDVTTHHPTTGAVSDADAAPTFDVFEEDTDTPILDDQTMTKRTGLTGNYRGSFTASAANGFEAGKWYNVVVTATVNSVTAKTTVLHFRVAPAESSAGVPKMDLSHWLGTAAATPTVAGVPEVDVTHFGGSAGAFASGVPAVNAAQVSGDATAADTLELFAEALDQTTGQLDGGSFASGAFDAVWSVATRTLTSISGLGIALADKVLAYFQLALRKDAAIATDRATELGELNADEGSGAGAYVSTTDSQEAIRDNMGTPQTGDSFARLGAPVGASISDDVAAVKGQTAAIEVDTQDIQGRLPAALVSGRMASDAVAISGSTAAADAVEANIGNLDDAVSDAVAAPAAALTAYDPPTRAEATADKNEILGKLQGLVLVGPAVIGSTGNDTTHIHLPGLTYGNDEINGLYLVILDDSAGEYHVREITDWVLATELATVATLPFTPQDATDQYFILSATAAAAGAAPTAAEVADAVWTEAIADHQGVAGSTAEQLAAAGAAGDPWATALPGGYASGQAGKIVGDNLNATVSSRATQTSVDTIDNNVDTLLTRITSTLFAGITSLAEWLGLIAGKQTGDSTARTELRATGAGSGTYDETADSQEAIRDRGDAAWVTATGFSTHSAADVWAVGTRTLTSFGTLVSDTATAVWSAGTRTLTAFDAAFKTGYALSSAGVQAIWDALTSALTTVGSIGKLLVDNVNATISSRASQSSADTDHAQTQADIAALENLSQAQAQTAAAAALTAYDPPTKAELDAAVATLATASALTTVDTVVDAIKVVTDALGATAAARLALSAGTILPGTVDTTGHSPTTTEFEADDITEATADHFIGRIVIFTSGALQYQATDITDYALVSGRGHFTVTALTEAPANNDTFVIV